MLHIASGEIIYPCRALLKDKEKLFDIKLQSCCKEKVTGWGERDLTERTELKT